MAGLIVPLGGEEEKKKPAQNLMADPQARAAQERFDKAKEVFSRYGSPMEAYTDPVAEADSQRAGINLLNGTEKAPADVARAMQIARRYGVPTEAIVPNQSEYARRLQTEDNVNTLTAAPRTRGWLADNPDAAALAQNDIGHMSRTEMALDYMWASTKAGTNALLASGAKLLETVLPGTSDEELAVLFKDRPEELKRMREESAAMFLSRFARERMAASEANMKAVSPDTQREYGTLQYATTQTEQAAYLSPVKVVSDALRSLPTTAAMAVTAYLTRGQSLRAEQAALASGASAEVAKQAGIKAAQETFAKIGAASEGAVGFAQQAVDTQGKVENLSQAKLEQSPLYQQMIAQGFDPYAARVLVAARTGQESGIGAGAVDAVTNLLGGKILGKVIGEGGSLLPRVGKGASTEAVTEFVQSAGEQVAENISMQANVNPDQSLGQDVLESALAGFFVGGLTGGVVAGVLGRDQQVRAAEDAHTALQEIDQAVAAAESRALDPETFRQFAESVEGAGDAVYIDGQTLLQSGRVEELVKAVPEIADQLEAAQLGTMVRIPMADYLTNVAGTELNQAIMPELRVDPNGMTFKESQEYNDKYAETLQQEVAAAVERKIADDAVRESAKRVEDRVFQELQSSGRWSDTVNRAYATLWKHRAVSMASRLNMTPEDFFNQRVLKVRSEPMGGREFDQGDGVEITEDRDEDTLYSITATLPSVEGNAFINAEANLDGSFQIKESGIPEGARGQGLGVRLYDGLLRDLFTRGAQQVTSDTSVSADAQRVYTSLRNRGYVVEQSPNVVVDPETGALEADGPVFIITPGALQQLNQSTNTFDPNNANILMQSLTTMVPKRKGVTVDPALVKVPGINEAEADDPKAKAALKNNVNLFDRKVQTVSDKELRGYDSINPQGDTPKERAESIIDQMVRNLLTIHDAIPEAIRNRSRLWYDGANRISLAFAQRYGLTPMQSAAQLAVLSPQADWFMNVSYAERINDILEYQQDHTWDADMDAWADSFIKGKEGDRQKEAARRAQAVKDAQADVRSAERAKAKAESALEKNTPKLEAKIAEAEQALKDAEQEVKVAKKDGTPATLKRAEKQRDKRNDELKAAREALRTAKSAVSKADTAIRQANRTLQEKTDYAAEPDENLSVQPFIRGKKLSELDTDFERAWWVRAYDEAHHPRSYRVVTPEGGFLDFAKTDDGNANNSIGWKSFSPISKAIAIRRDGSVENVHNMLGNEHKVRNFYNNIYDPNAPQPFVTSDTHQVAANLFLPLGSAALEVAQNFGGTGTKGVSEFGLYGTYWLYSEAVARAAKERGVLPREMQSISWEAIRSLFKPSFKSNDSSVNAVRDLWARHHAGEASYADTVNAIIELAGGYSDPSWVGIRPDSAAAPEAGQASYESELSHARQGLAERGQPGPGNEGVPGRELSAGSEQTGDGVLNQPARGSFNPETNTIALLKAADLSTFLHESGHFFLESQFAVAADLMQQSRMFGEDTNSPGEQSILDDTNAILRWFGINSLDEWFALDFEEKRAYHEKWAESFEAYLLEGKAPSIELQGVFNRFASWLKQVYKSIKDFLAANPAAGELTDEIRAVMDRMLATDEQIAIAQRTRSLMPLFATPEQAATLGVTIQDFQAYQQLGDDGKLEAEAQLQSRAVRDMKWLRNARSKRIRQMQREAKETRAEVRMVARREIMSQPVYQAWQFLTGKMTKEDKFVPPEVKRDKNRVQPSVDSLFEAIAKLGGLDFENVDTTWGWDERIPRPFFGKPLLRRDGKGKTIDEMAEALSELGYLAVDMHGKWDNAEFEDLFDDERRGKKHYSILVEPGAVDGISGEYTPDMTNVGAGRLDYFDLRRMTIPDQYKQIIVDLKMTAKEGGYPVSAVAEKFGFASAEDMVRELGFAEDPDVAIEALTDAKMLEEYGDLSSPEAIEEAADKALHNDMLARMVTAEANALARAVGKIPVMERAAREAATALINRLAVRNVKPYQYAAAAARAGKAADKAFKGGDVGAAADEKRNQTFNVFATKAAYDALDEYNKAREFFRRVLRGKDDDVAKSRDMDLVQAARSILAGYGYGGKAKAAIDYVKTIREYDADLYDMLDDTFARLEANAKPLRELTIEEVRTLRDEIESLWDLAKRMRQSEVDGDLLDREDIADELNDRMTEIGVPDALGVDSALTPEQERSLEIKGALSFGKRVEFWVDYMDGLATKFGAFRRFIFTPIKEAADRYRADRARYVQQFRDALTTIAPTMKAEEIAAPELGYTFGKANGGVGLNEVLHAILHTGNESNKRKLLLGRGWATENADGSVNTSRWDAFLARMVREGKLTREHFDFAQTVWDILESMKPAAQKAHREAYGKYFAEVTADSFDVTFPDGTAATYRGGYVPAKVDPLLVKDNELKKLIEEGKESMAYSFPSPASGFTKSRTEYNKPLLLDLRSLAQHIDSVLLFSHMKIPARDVAKLLAMPAVSQPLNRLDPAAINSMLMPWLQRSATQRVSAPVLGGKLYGKIANALRARTSMATMFANVMNATQQVTGFMLAAVKVKPKYLAEAMGVYLRNPSGVAEQVSSLSTYMENRMFSEVQDMMNEIERITVNPSILESAQDWTTRHMFFLQTAVDNVMGPIIWMGAYNEALATAPADVMADQQELEKYAQRLADAAVRQTQGSTLPEDVSRLETGSVLLRPLQMFMGYFNMQANLLGSGLATIHRDMGLRRGAAIGAYVFMLAFYAPALVAEAIALAFRGGPEDDEKDGYLDDWLMQLFLWGPLRNATAMVPYAGQAINSGMARFNGNPMDDRMSVSPVISTIEAVAGVPYDLYKVAIGEPNVRQTIRDVGTATSVLLGVPGGAVARPAGYVGAMAQERVAPTGPADLVRGLVTGVPSAESRQ